VKGEEKEVEQREKKRRGKAEERGEKES